MGAGALCQPQIAVLSDGERRGEESGGEERKEGRREGYGRDAVRESRWRSNLRGMW